ncbi:hypothetical protein [Phormidesmis priestleyi]|nr:hypothetical protein [Phormidesmis priestleyi]
MAPVQSPPILGDLGGTSRLNRIDVFGTGKSGNDLGAYGRFL